jgi:hypothetical protein
MEQIFHKRGDTLSLSCEWKDDEGDPIDITSITIASKVRSGTFSDDLVVTKTNSVLGQFTVTLPAADTALWPVTKAAFNRMFCDIQTTTGSTVLSTDTFEIVVVEDIT